MTNLTHAARRLLAVLGGALLAVARTVADQVPEALLLGGASALVYGVRLELGAGPAWIVGGVLALVAGWRLGRPQPQAPGAARGLRGAQGVARG